MHDLPDAGSRQTLPRPPVPRVVRGGLGRSPLPFRTPSLREGEEVMWCYGTEFDRGSPPYKTGCLV